MVERLVRIYIIGCLAVLFHSQIQASALPVHHPVRVTPGLSSSSIRTSAFTLAPLAARSGATPCWDFLFGCSVSILKSWHPLRRRSIR